MKLKISLIITALAVCVAVGIGMYKKSTYTDLLSDPDYLEHIYVGQIPENMAIFDSENMEKSLPNAPIIVKATAIKDIEYVGKAARQLVQVEEIYSGAELIKEQEVYVTCDRWSLSFVSGLTSVERGFVNIMDEGESYLLFITEQVDGLGEDVPIYRLFVENAVVPVFSYRTHDNVIAETNPGGSTYVLYNQVSENEFFANSEKGLEALLKLKEKMIQMYP